MSYDLFLHGFKNGDVFPVDRHAVLDVLRRYTDKSADRFGFYLVSFEDGSCVELSTKDLESERDFSHCAFHLPDFTFPVIRFVYEVALAGNMTLVNVQGDGSDESPLAVIFSELQRQHLPDGLNENPKLATSVAGLGQLLGCSSATWQSYRDRVVATHREG